MKGEAPTNRQVANLLKAVSAALEIKNQSQFRIIAYDRAATAIEHATSEVKDLWDQGQLQSLPGIGKNIASHLDELFKTGKVKHFEKLMKNLPPAMFELLEIPGIGAKTAWKLCEKLKIKNTQTAVTDLKKAAQEGKIRVIEGFGEDSEAKIIQGIEEFQRREGRILLPRAWESAHQLIEYLKKEKAVVKIDSLGSLRRMVSTVGDIDIAVATAQPQKVINHFLAYPKKKRTIEAGQTTASLLLQSGHSVDLMTKPPSAYGALLQHFTGSKHHNIRLREIAMKKGLSLSEYGIKSQKSKKIKEFPDEKSFYQALGMDWIPPELRENSGEIEAAQKGKLPQLIKQADLKGDLHLHSDFPLEPSHDLGANSPEQIIQKARQLGYQYLAFSEHNPSQSQHTPDQIISILKRKKERIDKLKSSNSKITQKIKVFNSLEIDIKPNGELALPEKAFATLDFAIASVHASFRLEKKKMTQRVLRALKHPKVKILGHPTGRKLNQREGFELDWDQVFAFCLKNKKALEINAYPDRLDLPDFLVREAVKEGVKMVIGSDAHSLEQMDLTRFGIAVARRGWAEKKDILNTQDYDNIVKWLINKTN